MQSFNASALFSLARFLEAESQPSSQKFKGATVLAPAQRERLRTTMHVLLTDCIGFDLKASGFTVSRMLGDLERPECTRDEIRTHVKELTQRVQDELSLTTILYVTPAERELLNPTPPLLSAEVAARFPKMTWDLEESSRCLGFGRYTAAVFHQLRVMELALKAIHGSLQLPDPPIQTRSWQEYLKPIRGAIDQMDRTSTTWHFHETAYALLVSVNRAWRNPTMHVEGTYGLEQAIDISSCITGFLKHLATFMDENGNPVTGEQLNTG